MAQEEGRLESLMDRAVQGDSQAREDLLSWYREKLKRMVSTRMDRRLASRVDASDVVQEALLDAHRNLEAYFQEKPLPFYPWLRQFAWNRLLDLHRRHILAGKRSVKREETFLGLSSQSGLKLARILMQSSSPSAPLHKQELGDLIRQALLTLNPKDSEILILRYMEKLSLGEIGAIVGLKENNVKIRHFRALEKIRGILEELQGEKE